MERQAIAGVILAAVVAAGTFLLTSRGDDDGEDASQAVTSTTAPSLSDRDRLADCEKRARQATVVYEPERAMTVGKTEQVRVVATVDVTDTTIPTFSTSTTRVPVELRCEVDADLYGSEFDVSPEEPQTGAFLDRPSIVWSWDVTPRHKGEASLTLEISSTAVVDGRPIPGAGGRLFDAAIEVKAKPQTFLGRIRGWIEGVTRFPLVADFASLAAIVAAVAAAIKWLWSRRKKLFSTAAQSSSSQPLESDSGESVTERPGAPPPD